MKLVGVYDKLKTATQAAADQVGRSLGCSLIDKENGIYKLTAVGDEESLGMIKAESVSNIKTRGRRTTHYRLYLEYLDPIFGLIKVGDRVKIVTSSGDHREGRATLANTTDELWVCKTAFDKVFIASGKNVVEVKRKGQVIYTP